MYDVPLYARNGHTLQVLAICRISTTHQDERSLDDQEALYRQWVRNHTDLPTEFKVIASQGSGEILDREELREAERCVESGRYDLVISEDLSRICRRMRAFDFCELCEDHDTRLVAINDHVDTTQEGWRLHSIFAAMKHEASNKDTALRIRRSLRNRFSQGGVVMTFPYGYIKPEGAKSDADIQKDPAAIPIYEEWFRMLENVASYAEVADWLNEQGVPTGPYCRISRWDHHMVSRITQNSILKGIRQRNRKMSRRINKTGRHKQVNAPPEELLERDCPHLAFYVQRSGSATGSGPVRPASRRNK